MATEMSVLMADGNGDECGGRREATRWWTKDNNDGGEGIGAMRS